MTTTEPTPEAVEALAEVLAEAGIWNIGDRVDTPDIARAVLAAGYVDHGTYAGVAMARDAAEQMHDRLEAENERLRQAFEKGIEDLAFGREWNELSRKEREARWPDKQFHAVSRPTASLRGIALLRIHLAKALESGS